MEDEAQGDHYTILKLFWPIRLQHTRDITGQRSLHSGGISGADRNAERRGPEQPPVRLIRK